ncbi:MAG: DMT family transporter [Cephaloticoccus sp.]|nr:DMT family transporter [Cephaloticoccus sp.]MCF7761404.1 DMT family transporter [Cephaloticoccus sp.]
MTPLALALVLTAAGLHATWNYCVKKAGGGLPFVYVVGLVICTLYVPVTVFYCLRFDPEIAWTSLWWILGSGVLKTSYSLFLQRSYRIGDFSLIYPLARGTGPLLSTLAAIIILGERPSGLAIAGGGVIITSIFFLTGGSKLFHQDRAHLHRAVGYGITSGIFIAAYTLWDRHGVAGLAVAPLLYDAGTALTQLLLLTPFGLRRWPEVKTCWHTQRRYVFGVALLSPLAYVLVLTALSFTPVSYVAPAREISIVIGAFIGARFLKEADGKRRLWAAAAMVLGVIALALG